MSRKEGGDDGPAWTRTYSPRLLLYHHHHRYRDCHRYRHHFTVQIRAWDGLQRIECDKE